MPALKKLEEKYHDKKIAFVSVCVDKVKDFEKWKNFVAENKLGGIQLFANKSPHDQFLKSYEISGIPKFILIDPTGKIVHADTYFPSNPKLQELFDKLL